MLDSKIYFIPFYFEQDAFVNSASVRYRITWPMKHLINSRLWKKGDNVEEITKDFDTVVFQKACTVSTIELSKRLKSQGTKIIFDVTDPINQFIPEWYMEMIRLSDCVTTSNTGLKGHIKKINRAKKVVSIEDGEYLEHYPLKKTNYEISKDLPSITWLGNSGTYSNLYYSLNHLKELEGKFILNVIAEKEPEFDFMNLNFYKWSLETVNQIVIDSDITINPRDPSNPLSKFKSQNKTNLSWALGVPCVYKWDNPKEAIHEIECLFKSKSERITQAQIGLKKVEKYYNSLRTAENFDMLSKRLSGKINTYQYCVHQLKDYILRIRVNNID